MSSLSTILKAYWLLAKWDYKISKQPYAKWKSDLDSNSVDLSSSPNQRFDAYPQQQYVQVAQLFGKVTRHHYRKMNCLRRCMALKELLISMHMPSNLHIGVRFAPELQAHSWLSVNGFIINDSKEVVSTYTEITNKSQFFQTSISTL
ncbi:lasso peptide biosynthesis B2 protein [Aliiglaciecola lipolytica]|uniref:Microcin J25-processing protein McjB C-terminal domain-containing protein n=1 Tax=Aliiglaciecola lipolytica E3 TaxID=1127673 RepID=K6YE44_9ALTE|nr:lasso peptide biosynthesis B2 protein [Aliiglaciecola lipolytica]GAC16432.1 hypothetical protein GLIP_3821 [Aliiglaciecola lipolytica E3]